MSRITGKPTVDSNMAMAVTNNHFLGFFRIKYTETSYSGNFLVFIFNWAALDVTRFKHDLESDS